MNADDDQATGANDFADEYKRRWLREAAGRTVYYPFGRAQGGYLVDDPWREAELRRADESYDKWVAGIGGLIGVLLVYPLILAFSQHPLLTPPLLTMLMVVVAIAETRFRLSRMSALLDGLQAVSADAAFKRRRFRFLGGVVLFIVGSWALTFLYELRLSEFNSEDVISFYPDIARKFLAIGFITLSITGLAMTWTRFVDNSGPIKTILLAVVLVLVNATAIGWAAMNFRHPTPYLTVSSTTIDCKGPLSWSDISDISLHDGRRGKETVVLQLVANTARKSRAGSRSCDIDGLHIDYHTVYQTILTHWRTAVAAAQADSHLGGSADTRK